VNLPRRDPSGAERTYPRIMNLLLAAQWGLSGALAAEALEFQHMWKRHHAFPWQVVADAETGRLCLDRRSKRELRPARLGFVVTVVLMGACGAVAAVCAADCGWISGPFLAIGIGFGAQQVLCLVPRAEWAERARRITRAIRA
jgi:hypothetical protein